MAVDLTNVGVLAARVRRAIEGPTGPPPGIPALSDAQVKEVTADAIADAILYSNGLFGHQLIVATRDPDAGYPTDWKTEVVLSEWEVSAITAQAALTYFFHIFKTQVTSETITNEGQSWEYELSSNLIRDQLKQLRDQRDMAMASLRQLHPVLDKYASILAVRDAQTDFVLEWYTRYNPENEGIGGPGGIGGGLEQSSFPWASNL